MMMNLFLEDVSYYVDPGEFVILTGEKWRCQVNADQKVP